MRGYTGWLPILLVPGGFGLFAAVEEPGPLIGLLFFLGMFIPLMYGTCEWFLLEHRIYRHGIVFRSLVPGMKTYVVPFYSCDITSFGTIGRRVHDGTDITQMVGRQFRQCPLTRTNITLIGLDPSYAMDIGSGKKAWDDGKTEFTYRYLPDGSFDFKDEPGVADQQRWLFSSRTPKHHIALLGELIAADQAGSNRNTTFR